MITTMPLTDKQLNQLIRLLNMLGTDHDGERAAFALKVHQIIKASGSTWEQLLKSNVYPRGIPPDPHVDWRDAVRCCSAVLHISLSKFDYVLHQRDLDYLASVVNYVYRPQPKELEWLHRVAARLESVGFLWNVARSL